jgi:beta-N-acetylhexosaminidase
MKRQNPAGELLMLRLVAPRWGTSLEQQLQTFAPGGIVLAGPLPHSPETLYELLGCISRCLPAPPILALEAECGGADPLSPLLPPLPSWQALAQKGARFTRQAGELIGEALKLLGFNTYFALTLDLASGSACVAPGFSPARAALKDGATFNPAQHPSTFSADPRVVAECGASFVEGLARHKILACAKHFPGLASVPAVAHGELSISGRPMAELWRSDLVPYRELLPRLPLVLMSAAAYKAYDFDYPQSAALSAQVVAGLLRAKLGYRGVVVAPQLESQPVQGILDMGRAAVQSLNAGCDMLLVEKDESWQAMRRGIEEALASGEFPRERLEQSLAPIRSAKKGCAPPKGSFSKKAWERLVRRFEEFSAGI